MNRLARVRRDSFDQPTAPPLLTQGITDQADASSLDPASLLGLFARVHALGSHNSRLAEPLRDRSNDR
jgi:hypothetical protein